LVAIILVGALLGPVLFWAGQWLAGHHIFTSLAQFDFELFFHRALLVAAVGLLWPFLRSIRVRAGSDLELKPNPQWPGDLFAGFIFAELPLLCCGVALIALHIFSLRLAISWLALGKIVAASIAVPVIEELFFRGLILGILLRGGRKYLAIFVTSALYSIVHFLKAPARTSTTVTWASGFHSIAYSLAQFTDPILVVAGFTTLFLIGLVLADARLRTNSLWLPIGLHAGWIFANGLFNKSAHREILALPWLGKSLLVGIIPLAIVCLTWAVMRGWLKRGLSKA
jgi:membrane protease YdiL (CAAX protease family)